MKNQQPIPLSFSVSKITEMADTLCNSIANAKDFEIVALILKKNKEYETVFIEELNPNLDFNGIMTSLADYVSTPEGRAKSATKYLKDHAMDLLYAVKVQNTLYLFSPNADRIQDNDWSGSGVIYDDFTSTLFGEISYCAYDAYINKVIVSHINYTRSKNGKLMIEAVDICGSTSIYRSLRDNKKDNIALLSRDAKLLPPGELRLYSLVRDKLRAIEIKNFSTIDEVDEYTLDTFTKKFDVCFALYKSSDGDTVYLYDLYLRGIYPTNAYCDLIAELFKPQLKSKPTNISLAVPSIAMDFIVEYEIVGESKNDKITAFEQTSTAKSETVIPPAANNSNLYKSTNTKPRKAQKFF